MIHETGRLLLKRSVSTSKERGIIDHIVCTISLLTFSPFCIYLESILNKRGDYIIDDEDTAIKRVGDNRYEFLIFIPVLTSSGHSCKF